MSDSKYLTRRLAWAWGIAAVLWLGLMTERIEDGKTFMASIDGVGFAIALLLAVSYWRESR